MSAREAILSKIRAKTNSGQPSVNQRLEVRLPVPVFLDRNTQDKVPLFKTHLEQVHGTCEVLESFKNIPTAIKNYLGAQSNTIKLLIAPEPKLVRLDWDGFEYESRCANKQDQVSVTMAFAGIAETGTIAMVSSRESPVSLSFLPETNIVILAQSRLVESMEDFWPMLASQPRAINFITGPSKTADIEQTIVYGAHGPRRFHVILING